MTRKKQNFWQRLKESPVTTILGCIIMIVAVVNIGFNWRGVLDLEWKQLLVAVVLLAIGMMLYNAPDDLRLWLKGKLKDTDTPFKGPVA